MIKKFTCSCVWDKKHLVLKGAYPYIDVPVYGYDTWSSSGDVTQRIVQLEHNFCPQCGKQYVERGDE